MRNVLTAMETALARRPVDYGAMIAALQDLTIPTNVTSSDLTRLYAACYRLLHIEAGAPPADLSDLPERQAEHLVACAREKIERSMYDSAASIRAWIAENKDRFRARGEPVPDSLSDDHLPPLVDIPWSVETATQRIRPYLESCEATLKDAPASHFKLCWDVFRDGYPAFQQVMSRWMADLERRGLGLPGTAEAISRASELYDKADAGEALAWDDCERDVLPLLEHRHPLVAAGAARYLGALYDHGSFDSDRRAPTLIDVLRILRELPRHRAAVCGAFISGFDSMSEGLSAFVSNESLSAGGFDLDRWVLDVLAAEQHEHELPNAQSFWFYVHEHYAANPDFIMRLIDLDRAWIAMMCATEIEERIEGMGPVLQRLAVDPDPRTSAPAQTHLQRHY